MIAMACLAAVALALGLGRHCIEVFAATPTSVLPKIIRVALATSMAVALKAKLDVIHPPVIVFTITLASGKHTPPRGGLQL